MAKINLAKMYTDKQVEAVNAYKSGGFSMMILTGAVRTGKTVVDNDIFLMELLRVKRRAEKEGVDEPIYILAGVSSKTIANNILNPLSNRYHIRFNFDKNGSINLFGVKIVMSYTGTNRGVGSIRGLTAYGAYINEATLATEEVFTEINNRVSKEGGRIICDTNPDSPSHYLKKDYIDKEGDPGLRLKVINFKLEDNKRFLGSDYIERLKASYGSGALYDRAILGLWTAGEGAIFEDWYDKENYIPYSKLPPIKRYLAGVDWGYGHYNSIVVIGEDNDGNTYLVDEYSKRLRDDNFWVNVARGFQEKYGENLLFIADPARPEYIARFNTEGLNTVNADKSVQSGIALLGGLIKTRRFKVVKEVLDAKDKNGETVSIFEDNIHNYIWNKKTGEVEKKHDDCLDAIRYVHKYIDNTKNSVDLDAFANAFF